VEEQSSITIPIHGGEVSGRVLQTPRVAFRIIWRTSVLIGVTTPKVKIVRLGFVAKTYRLYEANRNIFMQCKIRAFPQVEDRCNNLPLRKPRRTAFGCTFLILRSLPSPIFL
jgi:hypothetical protein